jgi:hypothetical protein
MRTSKMASVVAALTGLVWVTAGVLSWQDDGLSDSSATLWWVGVAGFGLASALVGYASVTRAPVWLRVLVFVCAGALGASVASVIDTDLSSANLLAAALGVVLVALGVVGLVRGRGGAGGQEPPVQHGRRAAR